MLLGDLDELSEHQRGALVLREMEGAGFARISEVFGVSEAAAKQTVYEARVCLADFEKGRSMRCEQITRALSDGDRRRLRGRAMRAHLRACHDCRTFGVARCAAVPGNCARWRRRCPRRSSPRWGRGSWVVEAAARGA